MFLKFSDFNNNKKFQELKKIKRISAFTPHTLNMTLHPLENNYLSRIEFRLFDIIDFLSMTKEWCFVPEMLDYLCQLFGSTYHLQRRPSRQSNVQNLQ